jgi:hypothetical protein
MEKQTFQRLGLLMQKKMSKQPEAIPAVRRKPEWEHHPEAANSSPLMDTVNIPQTIPCVKLKFSSYTAISICLYRYQMYARIASLRKYMV